MYQFDRPMLLFVRVGVRLSASELSLLVGLHDCEASARYLNGESDRGTSRGVGGFEGSFPEGAPNFLEVASVCEFARRIRPKQALRSLPRKPPNF